MSNPSHSIAPKPLCRLFPAALLLAPILCQIASAATYRVAPTGDDSAPGTQAAPVRTIQRAAELAQPGDTVLVAPGIYRERVAPPRGGTNDAPIVFRSQVAQGAVVRGSDVWRPQWEAGAPGVWAGLLEESLFTDTAHRDGANPFRVPFASTPYGREGRPERERGLPMADPTLVYTLGQVFVDGAPFEQAPMEAEFLAKARTWRYDASTSKLALHFAEGQSPDKHTVEVTTRRRLFAPHQRRLGFITVEGFTFEHCGNQYPTNFWEAAHPEWQQAGAVGTRSGNHWVIRNNVIRWAAGIGLDLGCEGSADADLETGDNGRATGAGHHLVEGNWIADNGAAGTASYNGSNLQLRGNVVERNNNLLFTGKKRWESAGIKLHNPSHSVIEGNLVRDNRGKWGIWLDGGGGDGTRVERNVVLNHEVGLDFEIGSAKPCLVANNVFIDNAVAVGTRESGGVTIAHNLILGASKAGVAFTIERHRTGNWNAAHNALFNNLFIGGTGLFLQLTTPDEVRSEDRRLDFNLYGCAPDETRFAFSAKTPLPVPLASWQAAWAGYNEGKDCDAHSRTVPGFTYTFDPNTLMLELSVPVLVNDFGAFHEPRIERDFTGKPMEPGPRIPGPIKELRQGLNRIPLWSARPFPVQ